jgi:hypothetical protein
VPFPGPFVVRTVLAPTLRKERRPLGAVASPLSDGTPNAKWSARLPSRVHIRRHVVALGMPLVGSRPGQDAARLTLTVSEDRDNATTRPGESCDEPAAEQTRCPVGAGRAGSLVSARSSSHAGGARGRAPHLDGVREPHRARRPQSALHDGDRYRARARRPARRHLRMTSAVLPGTTRRERGFPSTPSGQRATCCCRLPAGSRRS